MIASYEDLEVYKESYKLSLQIHNMTKIYPREEMYEIGSQLRRAAISIPLNIAEGYGKKDSVLEFKRYLQMAQGSSNEVKVLIDISKDLGYIEEVKHKELKEKYDILGRRINTLISKWK